MYLPKDRQVYLLFQHLNLNRHSCGPLHVLWRQRECISLAKVKVNPETKYQGSSSSAVRTLTSKHMDRWTDRRTLPSALSVCFAEAWRAIKMPVFLHISKTCPLTHSITNLWRSARVLVHLRSDFLALHRRLLIKMCLKSLLLHIKKLQILLFL